MDEQRRAIGVKNKNDLVIVISDCLVVIINGQWVSDRYTIPNILGSVMH